MLASLGQVLPAPRLSGTRSRLIDQGSSFTFRQLDELSGALAASLVGLGVVPGDRAMLCAPNLWEWLSVTTAH
jgi:non-ribosomal peptide synthetase component E (peptide arylation enzyme)